MVERVENPEKGWQKLKVLSKKTWEYDKIMVAD